MHREHRGAKSNYGGDRGRGNHKGERERQGHNNKSSHHWQRPSFGKAARRGDPCNQLPEPASGLRGSWREITTALKSTFPHHETRQG
jgi:hypothetical protein